MDDQTKQQAEILGRRLALLLASMPLPEEMKDAIAQLVPSMNADQLGKLIEQLEKELPDGTDLALSRMKEDMQGAHAAYTDKHDVITKKTNDALDELERQIP